MIPKIGGLDISLDISSKGKGRLPVAEMWLGDARRETNGERRSSLRFVDNAEIAAEKSIGCQ